MSKLRAGILVISETASVDPSTDESVDILTQVFGNNDKWEEPKAIFVTDDIGQIQHSIKQWTDGDDFLNLIVTTGGTGFAKKDHTPEAIHPLIDRHASGIVHGMLAASLKVTPFAMMARPVAGVRNKTLIITLPGSPKGAKENLEAVIQLLPHACVQAAGADSRSIHAGGIQKLERDAGVTVAPEDGKVGAAIQPHTHHHHHNHSHGGHSGPKAHTNPAIRPQSNDPKAGPSLRYRESPYPMLSVVDALDIIDKESAEPVVAVQPINETLVGFVLAEDAVAAEAVPAFRASIVDGYAVTISQNGRNEKGVFPVASVSHAAPATIPLLKQGQIARITTGAPLPPGASAVVMVEDTILRSMTEDDSEEKDVEILTDEVKSGENVREVGSDTKIGDVILRKGDVISTVGGELGLLASVGCRKAAVYRKPVVGVLSTGDEIVNHDRPGALKHGEVRDSNRPTLLSAIRGSGFESVDLGIASDEPGALEETLRGALRQVDVIITTGGVSMGELDLLKPTLERSLGGTIHFGRVNMKPGKPTTFCTVPYKDSNGRRSFKSVFALPGNPASAIVTFYLFVLPALHKSSGFQSKGLPKVLAVVEHDIQGDSKRPEYHRVNLRVREDGRLGATSTGGQRSSRIGSLKRANALLCLPASDRPIEQGCLVEALLMGDLVGTVKNGG
ncbi:MAG: hypothetical protein M1814_006603 [Vezdaea aestivalis]|nr:MAG: hypothetical protein M1814_006603 [Vezdaea aestivalis]